MRPALTLLLLALLLPATAAALPDDLPFQPEAGERWVLVDTDDYTEGFTARLEGREPEFEGK